MVQYIITPWRSQGELLEVRQHFYPPQGKADEKAQKRAVEKVSVWMQRGNCPHSVESTAILTSAQLNDVSANSNYCVRAAYSAAFSRFVTGLLDSHQTRKTKQSMYSLAKTLTPPLPATFVELRHQATHEELPSLPKLRSATRKALEWIWGYYWAGLTSSREYEERREESCLEFLRRVLGGEDAEELDEKLDRWSEREIMDALLEIDASTEDPEVLLASTKLKKKILGGDTRSEPSTKGDGSAKSVEEMMKELAQMQENLSDGGSEESESESEGDGESVELGEDLMDIENMKMKGGLGGKGWQRWEGPWTPKPIGTIC